MAYRSLVNEFWRLRSILRDDGVAPGRYMIELSYLFFLKAVSCFNFNFRGSSSQMWRRLMMANAEKRLLIYKDILCELGDDENPDLKVLFKDAKTQIANGGNLTRMILTIERFDWGWVSESELGAAYELLLGKCAADRKVDIGGWIVSPTLCELMVRLADLKAGERCYDPYCGAFGFLTAALRSVGVRPNWVNMRRNRGGRVCQTYLFCGAESDPRVARLAAFNAVFYELNADAVTADIDFSERNQVILTKLPLYRSSERDRSFYDERQHAMAESQLERMVNIPRLLTSDGSGRAVVLFSDEALPGDDYSRRKWLEMMGMCEISALLKLPDYWFYAERHSWNALVFSCGLGHEKTDKFAVCDLRSGADVDTWSYRDDQEELLSWVRAEFPFTKTKTHPERIRWWSWKHFYVDDASSKEDALFNALTREKSEEIQTGITSLREAVEILNGLEERLKQLERDNAADMSYNRRKYERHD